MGHAQRGHIRVTKVRYKVQRARTVDREIHQVSDYASVSHFLRSEAIPPGISAIWDGEIPIDLLISPGKSPTTICFFHGAIEHNFTLPVLSGLGVSGGLEANRVFISDPSLFLDESLMLAWYAGNIYQPDLQSKLVAILTKVFETLNSERIMFFGGSGGGFAALYFAYEFPNSEAIVFNPQTNIARYRRNAVRHYAERAFKLDLEGANLLGSLPKSITTDVCELYRSARKTRVTYLQNSNDRSHVKSHLLPFLQSVDPEVQLMLLLEPWRKGHTPPPKSMLQRVLDTAASEDYNSDSLLELGFRQVVHSQGKKPEQIASGDEYLRSLMET